MNWKDYDELHHRLSPEDEGPAWWEWIGIILSIGVVGSVVFCIYKLFQVYAEGK